MPTDLSTKSTVPTTATEEAVNPRTQKKPLRFKIGVALLVLYPFFYLVFPVAPFLPLDTAAKGAVIAVVIGAAEVILLIAIALMGKEAYQAIKARLFKRSTKTAANEGLTRNGSREA